MAKEKDYDMVGTLKSCASILGLKGHDYGESNFVLAVKVASVITGKNLTNTDVAACLIGIKCTRYGYLTGRGIEPVNESVDDTLKDLINYVVLMERERVRSKDAKRGQTSK